MRRKLEAWNSLLHHPSLTPVRAGQTEVSRAAFCGSREVWQSCWESLTQSPRTRGPRKVCLSIFTVFSHQRGRPPGALASSAHVRWAGLPRRLLGCARPLCSLEWEAWEVHWVKLAGLSESSWKLSDGRGSNTISSVLSNDNSALSVGAD